MGKRRVHVSVPVARGTQLPTFVTEQCLTLTAPMQLSAEFAGYRTVQMHFRRGEDRTGRQSHHTYSLCVEYQ